MKTIQQIADEIGVKRQTVYNKAAKAGVVIDTLTHQKQGKKTVYDEEAERILKGLFTDKPVIDDTSAASDNDASDKKDVTKDRNDKSKSELDVMKERVAALTKELEAAHNKIDESQMEIERLRAAEEELRHTVASQAETIRMKEKKELLLLEAPMRAAIPVKEVGFFGKIVRKIRGLDKVQGDSKATE